MLHEFLTRNRAEIVARCRAKVVARSAPGPTPADPKAHLDQGVPLFLDQLADTLRLERSSGSAGICDAAARHGQEMLRMGCTVEHVVKDYGDICQSITELAIERLAPITTPEFRTLNRCLDDAIANAVTAFDEQRDRRISDEATQRHGFFAHEIRNLLATAMLSFEVLRMGGGAVRGSTGAVLARNLSRLRDFIDRSLADVRLEASIQNRERISVAELVDEVEASAAMEARTRGLRLMVERAEGDAAVDVDRLIVASVVANLVQNAFKFTRPDGHVSLRSRADADRVSIEVEDECGGLPPGDPETLFLPFEQRSADRSGLGLGLAMSKRAAEASGGALRVRDLPGIGCVFTLDLPRASRQSTPIAAAVNE